MRLSIVLPVFALLLVASTAISFLGYRYLSLASEYRARNFLHFSETQSLLSLLANRPILRQGDVAVAAEHIRMAQAQAAWCLDVLSPLEKRAFLWLGAGNALDLCRADIATTASALATLEQFDDPEIYRRTGQSAAFAVGLTLRRLAIEMQSQSLEFRPYVSATEAKLRRAVRLGTLGAASALGLIFVLLSRELIRAYHLKVKHSKELSELAVIAQRANDAIVVTDLEGRVTWVNPAFETLSEYSLAEMKGKFPGRVLQGPETDHKTVHAIGESIRNQRAIRKEILNYTKAGVPYWVMLSISPLENEMGECYGFVAISDDRTREREQREAIAAAHKEIEQQALHDPLTELPNRRALDLSLKDRESKRECTTIVRIDLDHFKYVNDTIGHDAGDFVLCEVGRILREETDAQDLPARVGGDEFLILLRPGTVSGDGVALAERILKRVRAPLIYQTKTIRVGASFGVASSADGILPTPELVVGADAALYEAKELGRNCIRLYTPDLHTDVLGRRCMARELRRAVASEEFEPHFHPQFDAYTRELVGVETLARWDSDELGFMQPDQFLPVAQRLSMIEEIDDIIFRKAIQSISELNADGALISKLSVNVTAQRVQEPKVLSMVREIKDASFRIAFEVLESVLIEEQSEIFQYGIDCLRDVGVSIEIDDFGSGHASIIGLMQLRPDAMKIDKRLVSRINSDRQSHAVLRNIIGIAQSMNLTVIAEGVETMDHADTLTELGCHVLQGYAFCQPMDVHALREFVASYRPRPWDLKRVS
ncbi:MAG: EAL domain-containing protein [Pseudomonadota bacterium]